MEKTTKITSESLIKRTSLEKRKAVINDIVE